MEVETEQPQQQAEPQQAQPQVTNLQLSILATIKSAQLQNGLKHGDYSRYRWVGMSEHACGCFCTAAAGWEMPPL